MNGMTRRGFLVSAGTAAAGASLAGPGRLFGQDAAVPPLLAQYRAAAAKAKIATVGLRRGVSALMGSGGNIAVLPGKDGMMVVDSGFATSQPQVAEAMKALGGAPPAVLIDTHWHFDHTDGNAWMHSAGATIMATEKTRERLSTTQTIAAMKLTLPPSPAAAIPQKTFTAQQTLHGNDEEIVLTPYAPAHTDTDTWVYFVQADVLHTGDTWWNGLYPFIDSSSGGSIDGMIEAAEKNLGYTTDKTIVVPGHGPIGNRAQLQEFHDMLAASRTNIAKLKRQGKTLEETIAAKPTAPFDARFGQKPEAFIGYVYQGV